MIPKKLQIKNFLSYGPETQTINFLPYNLICLSGKNGHGKSALLDAITWALWGQARKTTGTSKADEGLVHLGQKHMLVTFDFEINSTAYRVRREFVKTQSTPFSALDFGIVKADETFTTLTDKTIKLTQTKLEKTIGITFESFINSAFLRQGQANEFSKKSPKERKDILATILQLDRFEDLKKVALEKIKTIQQSFLQKEAIYNRITQEIIELQTALIEKEEHTKQLKLIEKEQAHLQKIIIEDEEKKATLLELHKQYEILEIQKKEQEQQAHAIDQQIQTLQKVYQEVALQQYIVHDIDHLEKKQKQLQTVVRTHQEKLNKRLELKDQYLTLQEKKLVLEKELNQKQSDSIQKYEINIKILEEQLKQNQQQLILEDNKLKAQLIELSEQQDIIGINEHIITEQTKNLSSYTTDEKQFEEHKNQYQAYKTQANLLEQQIKDIEQKHTVSSQTEIAHCPLCEQILLSSSKDFLQKKLNKNYSTITAELKQVNLYTLELEALLSTEQAKLQLYKKDYDALTMLISQTQSIKEQAQKLAQQIKTSKEQIALTQTKQEKLNQEIAKALEEQNKIHHDPINQKKELDYKSFIKKIDVLKQTAQALAYKKEDHEQDTKQLEEIDTTLNAYQAIQKEIAQQEQRQKQIIDLQTFYKKIQLSAKNFEKQIEDIKNCPHQLKDHLKIEQEHKKQIHEINIELAALHNKQAIFDLQYKKMLTLDTERVTLEKELKSINTEIIDFTEICKALGKDGLQALLIEQALPEIEQQANILLAQLTDNQTQIYIESLRDLKKGGSKETLDIKISDAIGLRPYEMFSGGEAFRIDFALRIAISKLLARRAGTALQTLIIDEGFGSQDDEGLQLIMDSILKIQDNFAKIIIVSHLPSMKEQFPVQFLVQKKASGSMITVIQQG